MFLVFEEKISGKILFYYMTEKERKERNRIHSTLPRKQFYERSAMLECVPSSAASRAAFDMMTIKETVKWDYYEMESERRGLNLRGF